ncbi:MAG TPA: 3-dehydroquinate synthase [Chthoniobacterales bacterium]|nr:3-dehydroquinate synthase [Chthoniobacterales bacterium]
MKSLEIRAGRHGYKALIGPGLLGEAGRLVRPLLPGGRCAIVSDEKVAPLFAESILGSLRGAGFAPELLAVPSGEGAKSMTEVSALCEQMSAAGLDRTSFLVSLGGGVISDLAGFVAAIYFRGIPYISVPTTLLAQVDSCIGGKTGVNSSAGKNLIGAFHHPVLVLADTDTLETLPERIWNEGFAEAIKHGIVRDAALFEIVAQTPIQFADWKPALPDFIARNLALKAEIVAADEREQTGARSLLNFGHTIGHAIEHAAGYGLMLHGEAISLGMVAAAQVSVRRAGLSLGEVERIKSALRMRQLPITLPPGFPREKIIAALPRDKKFENGRIRFAVAHEIGRASVSSEVTMEDMAAAVAAL